MGEILINTGAFIVAISILVAIHEYGHYVVGRWAGMKVLRFSIGFGKPIKTWIRGADRTEYCISAIPLGGYVRFLDEREGPVDPGDEGRAFNHRPIPARIAVLLAGPLFNFLFAVVAYWALFVSGIPSLQPAVGEVTPGSYADRAGLRFGDRILAVGDEETADWQSALVILVDRMAADGEVPLTLVDEDGDQRRAMLRVGDDAARLTEPENLFDGLGFLPWRPPAVIGELSPDGAAIASGLETGDRIVAIDGEEVRSFNDLVAIVEPRPGKTVVIEFVRDGRIRSTEAVIGEQVRDGRTLGLLGVSVSRNYGDFLVIRKYGPIESVQHAAQRTWTTTIYTLRLLGRMVTGDVSIKNISSPIGIAQYAGESAKRGLDEFLSVLALISISLGVLNLLPIPVLDGGQIVYQTAEAIKGSPLSERAQIIGQQFGILALILLMSFAFYNDIARILN